MKLQKKRRREQLLDVGLSIVREQGADELTLGNLAVAAGVSRPVAYEHFSTRAGLLIALYQRLEDSYVRMLKDGLAAAPQDLETIAAVMSASYFSCLSDIGPEALAISAAPTRSSSCARSSRASAGASARSACGAGACTSRAAGVPGPAGSTIRSRCSARASERLAVAVLTAGNGSHGVGKQTLAGVFRRLLSGLE